MPQAKFHILIVDDEPNIRATLQLLLCQANYDVSTAEDGFDALLQLKVLTPDVIISDLSMPRMSGFEFLSVVRRRFPEIPVVAISGVTSPAITYRAGSLPTRSMPKAHIARTNSCARSPT